MSITHRRSPHRLARPRERMEKRRVDVLAAAGADHLVHLAGYSRYLGVASAAAVENTFDVESAGGDELRAAMEGR